MAYDLIIRNGMVIDGSGMARFRADVGVAGGKIAAIGKLRDSGAHDLRTSAMRNLERAGVPRSAAMKMTGHETASIYRAMRSSMKLCCAKAPRSSQPFTRPKRTYLAR